MEITPFNSKRVKTWSYLGYITGYYYWPAYTV